jgi:acyl-coenzyme A synthetase/AMP-(fatty) acid ligase
VIKFWFVESYPKTASGKVQKFILRENAIKALRLEEVTRMRTAQVSYWFKREYDKEEGDHERVPGKSGRRDWCGQWYRSRTC